MALADFEPLLAIRTDPRVAQYTGGVRTRGEIWTNIQRSAGSWALLDYGYWALCARESGALIGEVGFSDFQRGLEPDISGMPEAGWILAPGHWGQGLASEAVSAIHQWLDATLAERAVCIISEANSASIRIAGKQGYHETARSRMGEDPVIIFHRNAATRRA
ncbi:MAG: GNAT family N-acetyltransferase [Hyphomonadaceae bacterium]|nr:GNAT family N-acetyltransferase [Hyphomonadaceae bacterium]